MDGGDLTSWIAGYNGAPPPPIEIVNLLLMVCRGLAHAHSLQIVHRDLKPANVLWSRDGGVKLTDFGVASLGRAAETAKASQTTKVLGGHTPFYADPYADNSPKFDVYGLGMIAYQLVMSSVERPLVPAWHQELMLRTSPELVGFIASCLDRPSNRPANGTELCQMLESLRERQSPPGVRSLTPAVTPVEVPSSKGRSRASRVAAAAVSVAVFGLGGWYLRPNAGGDTDGGSPPPASGSGSGSVAGTSTSPDRTPQLRYVPPLSERPSCAEDCTPGKCGYYQISGGPSVRSYLALAETLRQQTDVCSAVFHMDSSKLPYPKDQFAITLGSVTDVRGQELLRVHAALIPYGSGMLSGRKFKERVYPPPCLPETISYTQGDERMVGPGGEARCKDKPPLNALHQGAVWSWNSSPGRCACQEDRPRLTQWQQVGQCLEGCSTGDSACITDCEGRAPPNP